MADDHTKERYRDELSRGGHGAHKPCEKFPIEDAREQEKRERENGPTD
jgi:hypothetical protein